MAYDTSMSSSNFMPQLLPLSADTHSITSVSHVDRHRLSEDHSLACVLRLCWAGKQASGRPIICSQGCYSQPKRTPTFVCKHFDLTLDPLLVSSSSFQN